MDDDRKIVQEWKSLLACCFVAVFLACSFSPMAEAYVPSQQSQSETFLSFITREVTSFITRQFQTIERTIVSALPNNRPGEKGNSGNIAVLPTNPQKNNSQQVLAETNPQRLTVDMLPTAVTNLLHNSSFEQQSNSQPRDWNYQLDSNTSNTFISAEGNRSGSYGLKLLGGGTGNFGISQPNVKTVPGRIYTFSLYVKTTNVLNSTLLRFGFWDEYHNSEGQMKSISLPVTQDWTRYSFTITTPGLITDPKNEFPLIEVEGLTRGAVYLDDMQLEEGSVLTAYNSSQAYNSTYGIGDGSLIFSPGGDIYPAYPGAGQVGSATNQFQALNLTNASIDSDGNFNLNGSGTIKGGLTLGSLTINGSTLFSGTTSALQVNNGGTGATSFTKYGVLYGNGTSALQALTPGTSGYVLQSNGTGTVPSWVAQSGIIAGSVAFNNITSGTNTQAAMVVGSGASFTYSGGTATSGVINANQLLGGTWAIPGTIGSTTANSAAFSTLSASGGISANGGLTLASGQNLTLSGLTSGSIPFINSSNQLTQDNGNLFWDATNKRVGIGTNGPAATLDLLQATQTSGAPNVLKLTGGANTGLTAGNDPDIFINLGHTVGYQGSSTPGAANIANQYSIQINSPSYGYNNTGAQTITNAFAMYLNNSPAANASNTTITNSIGLKIDNATNLGQGGTVTNAYGLYVVQPAGATNSYGEYISSELVIGPNKTPPAHELVYLQQDPESNSNAKILHLSSNQYLSVPVADNSDVLFDLAHNIQFLGSSTIGAANLASTNAFEINAPNFSYSNTGQQTITSTATQYINNPPISLGSNTTITNSYGLLIDNANSVANGGTLKNTY